MLYRANRLPEDALRVNRLPEDALRLIQGLSGASAGHAAIAFGLPEPRLPDARIGLHRTVPRHTLGGESVKTKLYKINDLLEKVVDDNKGTLYTHYFSFDEGPSYDILNMTKEIYKGVSELLTGDVNVDIRDCSKRSRDFRQCVTYPKQHMKDENFELLPFVQKRKATELVWNEMLGMSVQTHHLLSPAKLIHVERQKIDDWDPETFTVEWPRESPRLHP